MLQAVNMGINTLFLDIDQVDFINPISFMQPDSHVMVSKYCPGGMDRGNYGNKSLGTPYLR